MGVRGGLRADPEIHVHADLSHSGKLKQHAVFAKPVCCFWPKADIGLLSGAHVMFYVSFLALFVCMFVFEVFIHLPVP